MSDLRSWGHGFNSRLGRYQVVSTWMGDCLRTDKSSSYITNTKVNSAFHPSRVGESSASLHGWDYGGAHSPVSDGRLHCVIPYGRWCSVALRWVFHEELYHFNRGILTSLITSTLLQTQRLSSCRANSITALKGKVCLYTSFVMHYWFLIAVCI